MSELTTNGVEASISGEELAELAIALGGDLPSIPSRYLYDDHGSDLFEQITEVPEYYQTRTEISILEDHADDIIAACNPRQIAELGSGAGRKVGFLVEAGLKQGGLRALVMFDINDAFLNSSVAKLQQRYPSLAVSGVVGRFTQDLHRFGQGGRRLICFFGSTIGNFHPNDTVEFMRQLGSVTGPDDALLIGFDLVKDIERLEAAYNDAAGVTAAFNRNILRGFNRSVGADFDPSAFEHVAFYDADNAWIEMRLRAIRPTRATVEALGWSREFALGDELRTEISCKYTRTKVSAYAQDAGLVLDGWYTDPEGLFALALIRAERA